MKVSRSDLPTQLPNQNSYPWNSGIQFHQILFDGGRDGQHLNLRLPSSLNGPQLYQVSSDATDFNSSKRSIIRAISN
jgi:hypothetical protein